MPKEGRTWFPLDANFTRDEKVLRAGEGASWLYIAILGNLKMTSQRGTITREQVAHLGVPRWETRLQRLVMTGLVEESVDDTYWVPAWESWQTSSSHALYMRTWREQRRKRDELRAVEDMEEP